MATEGVKDGLPDPAASRRAGEPWMRGTHDDFDPLRRGVVHALELAEEDVQRWCAGLSDGELLARLYGLPAIAFQLRHMGRSLDRLLTYAENRRLSEAQLEALSTEDAPGAAKEAIAEFWGSLAAAKLRVGNFDPETYTGVRGIGRQRLPTTVGGLLIHCAEHTQRHAGQMVTTAKLIRALRREAQGNSADEMP